MGEPTILVNNAGVVQGRTILDASERDIRFTFDVNTFARKSMEDFRSFQYVLTGELD